MKSSLSITVYMVYGLFSGISPSLAMEESLLSDQVPIDVRHKADRYKRLPDDMDETLDETRKMFAAGDEEPVPVETSMQGKILFPTKENVALYKLIRKKALSKESVWREQINRLMDAYTQFLTILPQCTSRVALAYCASTERRFLSQIAYAVSKEKEGQFQSEFIFLTSKIERTPGGPYCITASKISRMKTSELY